MTDAEANRGIGDNQPPEPTPLDRAAELVPVCDEWTTKGQLTSEDEARVLGEFLVQIREARAALVVARDADTAPLKNALAVVEARYRVPLMKLDLAIERIAGRRNVPGLLADWMAREARRRDAEAAAKLVEAEEAKRLAERATDRAAIDGTIDAKLEEQRAIEEADAIRAEAERKPERVRIKGDLAPKALSLATYWSAKIIDWKLAAKHYAKDPRVVKAYRDAIQTVANEKARHAKDAGKAPKGVEFIKREQVQ